MSGQDRLEAERCLLGAWGQTIGRYRRWKQLSRRALARRAGLSPAFLGEIERGEKDPSSHSLCLLAQALDVPLAELYLRVASRLEGSYTGHDQGQAVLPLTIREADGGYLDAVLPASDDTAFDLYKIVRGLQADQQISLLILARSLQQRRS